MNWLDGLSLWWYTAGAVFILSAAWLAMNVAPVMDEYETVQHTHKPSNKQIPD